MFHNSKPLQVEASDFVQIHNHVKAADWGNVLVIHLSLADPCFCHWSASRWHPQVAGPTLTRWDPFFSNAMPSLSAKNVRVINLASRELTSLRNRITILPPSLRNSWTRDYFYSVSLAYSISAHCWRLFCGSLLTHYIARAVCLNSTWECYIVHVVASFVAKVLSNWCLNVQPADTLHFHDFVVILGKRYRLNWLGDSFTICKSLFACSFCAVPCSAVQ